MTKEDILKKIEETYVWWWERVEHYQMPKNKFDAYKVFEELKRKINEI